MANKKIVFVWLDEAYISTIEYKLGEILYGKAEVEFITNRAYLEQFFQSERQTDILVIPKNYESFIDDRFSKTKIVWLTEDKEIGNASAEGRLDETYIYVYSSVRTMIDQMDDTLLSDSQSSVKNQTKVLSVFSVVGGCGKTLSALGIAHGLVKDGNKVLYVSTELMQDYKYYMDDVKYISSDFGYQCAVNMEAAKRIVMNEIEYGDIAYLKPFSVLPLSYQVSFEKYIELVQCVVETNSFDYIVVELSKELDPKKISFMQDCYRTVFVTTQDQKAVSKLIEFINSITKFSMAPLVVCNRYCEDKKDYVRDSELTKKCEIGENILETDNSLTWDDVKRSVLFSKVATLL